MSGEPGAAADAAKSTAGEGRQRSTIGFPYMDLSSAIELAQAIFSNVAGGECDDDQLAAWTNQSSKSSTFRVQVYAARTFGVLGGEASRHKLTDLGLCIVDPLREREAKIRAFLTVPLYSAVFERFRGGQLPPAAALEREMVGLGVAPKQKDRARQVFERSAEQAGFFAHGRDRLIQPGVAAGQQQPPPKPEDHGGGGNGGGNGGGGGDDVDPIIRGLLVRLPKAGGKWPEAERKLWLQLLEGSFKLIYKDGDESAAQRPEVDDLLG